jgi:hypothetical protein
MSFKVFGLDIQITQSSLIGSIILLIVYTGVALVGLQLAMPGALIWGLIAVLLHWLGEFVHQYGHLMAGRRVGYPLTGMRLWWIFAGSIYPADEPTLPASVHIKRALGGAPVSIAVGVVFGILALVLKDSLDSFVWGLLAFFAALNFFFFGLGAFLPLGFTDGSTLLHYWGKS